ncbi:peptidoglycan-recognition protein 2-like [Macrosteles quadrilineatus]|uniref:peptidoglycan-recognition protein 2-like n=1 Tax=Macrosteles quadrilineatus TaxID=74068 RepID=UPI0023E179C5|nr:peptidoglycan-recognition protein 2-like [Macrosteles quadrilineatus]
MKVLAVHGTHTKPCTTKSECIRRMQEIQIVDIYQKKMPDINYNFLIGGDGNVYEGRGFAKKVSPTSDYVPNSLVVGFIGNWAVEEMPEMFEEILTEFCRLYVKEGKINPNYKDYFEVGY